LVTISAVRRGRSPAGMRVSSGYRKFSSRFAGDGAKARTFASFATFTDGGRDFEAQPEIENGTPEIQSASVKVAQVAKVERPTAPDASVGPDHTKVTIVEIPREAGNFKRTFAHLQLKPPALVDVTRWRQCVKDGKRFLGQWGSQAEVLGWTSADLFGLHTPPERPHPSYRRLSRYDATGLIWLLEGRPVVALTESTAAIGNATGSVTTYRKHNKPALGPLGDSLEI